MPVQDLLYEFKDQFSFVRAQLVLFLEVKNIRLTHNEIDAFTWIVIDGWSTDTQDKIKSLNILNGNSINNLGSKLSKLGLLVNKKKGVREIAPALKILSHEDSFIRAGIGTSTFLRKLNVGNKSQGSGAGNHGLI
jgi:hypothetical protein